MKVTIVVGGKFHAFQLAKSLQTKNYLDEIITSYPYSKIDSFIDPKRIKTIILKEIIKKLIDKLCPQFLWSKLNYFNDDLFDYFASIYLKNKKTDIFVGWSGFSKRSFEKLSNINCVKVLERGSSHIQFQHRVLKKEYEKLNLKANLPSEQIIKKELKEYELADYICVPSNFAKKTFVNMGIDKNKVHVFHLGVDLNKFSFEEKKQSKNKKIQIISSGEVSIRKGSHQLMDAFIELNLNNCELLFAGNIENGLKDYFYKKKRDNIKFLGSLDENSLNKIYNESDIFILNSIEDGFGMVIPQAMACGLPIITTFNTGASEIVVHGKNGYVINSGDKLILKEKIKKLYLDQNLRDEMSKNSIQIIYNKFSWDNYGRKVVEFYEQIYKKNNDKA